MADCKYMPECPFYNDRLPDMPERSEFYKMEFCHKRPPTCARFQMHEQLGLKSIPDDIMPKDEDRVKDFLG
jgi:hypothetical protein